MKRFAIHAVLGLAVITGVVGCPVMQKGTTVVKWEKGGTEQMTEAARDGEYALYRYSDTKPQVTYSLKKGDPLGFTREGGTLYVVAGEKKQALKPDTDYYINRR